jgi:glycosyltransferase involved in cell wall biosynthesis
MMNKRATRPAKALSDQSKILNARRASKSTITIVLPWYGPDTAGGAEAQARQLVAALHAAGAPVEVWATTAKDAHAPLAPYYTQGDDEVDGVPVHRFAPNKGTEIKSLLAAAAHHPAHEVALLQSLTGSDELIQAIERERNTRRWLFFLYAFPLSFWGAQIVGERGVLVPCLHDEPYARYTTTRRLLRTVRRVLANSAPEQHLICQLADLPEERVPIAGEGIDLERRGDGAHFRTQHRLSGPLVLFVGRRDHSKNLPLLLAYFEEYLARRGPQAKLVVAGPGPLSIPAPLRPWLIDVGFLPAQAKHDAYATADVFCMPSTLESFCIVQMEAWLQGTPALVHRDCAVTMHHCRESNGGLHFRTYRQFEAALDLLLCDQAARQTLGAQGQAWVQHTCRWNDVAQRVLQSLDF